MTGGAESNDDRTRKTLNRDGEKDSQYKREREILCVEEITS